MNVAVMEKPTPVKRSKLKAVDPKSAEPSKPKVLIFGKPGIGKTWTSLDFPKVYYWDSEGGATRDHYTDKLKQAGGVYVGIEQGSQSFDTLLEQIQALTTEKHDYKTLVIDSISKLFNDEVAREAEKLGDKNAFGADKKPAVLYMRRLCRWITKLDMNVILIAHEKPEWGQDSKGDRTEVGQTYDCWDKMSYELDLCLQIIKAGDMRKARVKKSRLIGFPDASVLEWSYASFAERYGREIMERAASQVVMATDEQIGEALSLITKVTLDPKNPQDKWIADNQAELAEVEAEKMSKIITYLKGKVS